MVYRKAKGYGTRHFCTNCSRWPTSNYDEYKSTSRPTNGELCNECRAKEASGNCRKQS